MIGIDVKEFFIPEFSIVRSAIGKYWLNNFKKYFKVAVTNILNLNDSSRKTLNFHLNRCYSWVTKTYYLQ